jgi:ABC-type lipoprotein export system ATPase subunit
VNLQPSTFNFQLSTGRVEEKARAILAAVIRLRDVSRRYPPDREVLRGVDLDVEEGEMVAVVGRSGSGKTTLINIVGGLDSRFDGTVEVAGRSLRGLADRALSELRNRTIGFVFQAYHLLDHLTVAENAALVALFARGHESAAGQDPTGRADEVLASVGLAGRGSDRPATLSGGERQRLTLARALFHRPRILLCDEPTGNLDLETGTEIIELIRKVHRDHGTTVVVVTHDVEISRAADRVLRLLNGRLVGDGSDSGGSP